MGVGGLLALMRFISPSLLGAYSVPNGAVRRMNWSHLGPPTCVSSILFRHVREVSQSFLHVQFFNLLFSYFVLRLARFFPRETTLGPPPLLLRAVFENAQNYVINFVFYLKIGKLADWLPLDLLFYLGFGILCVVARTSMHIYYCLL